MALDYTPPEEIFTSVTSAYDADRPPPFQPELFAPFPIAVVTIQPVPQYVAPVVPTDLDIEERISRAEGVLTRLLLQKRPVAVSWSAGKDSSAVLSLLLVAAVKLRLDGHALPPIVVVHSDTGVENPEMSLYARSEILQVVAYAKRHNLPVTVSVAHPNLTSQWAVRVIATLGMMEVKSGMQNEIDQMLRRSQFKRREGLDGQMDVSALWARAVSADEAGLASAQAPKTRVRGAAGSRSVAHASLEASLHEEVGALMVERDEEAAPASLQNN